MPQLEITHDDIFANMGRGPQIRAAMWARRPPERREDAAPTPCPAPAPLEPPCQRKGVNLYPFPIGPWPHNPDAEFDANRPVVKPSQIIHAVAEKHDVSADDIVGSSRVAYIMAARLEVYFRLREELKLSWNRIGMLVGGRDHTSALSGWRKFKRLLERGEFAP